MPSQIHTQDRKKVFVIGKIKEPSLINSIQYLKIYDMLHDFLCLFVKQKKEGIYKCMYVKIPSHNNNSHEYRRHSLFKKRNIAIYTDYFKSYSTMYTVDIPAEEKAI